ncbi:hypothetical protein SAMN05216574_10797 [Blastococcus tunisiensis]|uniref:Uncharacterized protein n=1 Tax=Blastococcus tunisiensis TaxID=1798228 RepID=A0A1I2EKW2_9ACTN|nr:hypothetical protein SAMN05216574_10797 [Blastococcus sp. DSM 46838]
MTTPGHRPLICSHCGEKQPTDGALTTDDGTPISIPQYVALAGLVDGALVCSACVTASALTPAMWAGAGTPRRPEPGRPSQGVQRRP